MNAEFDPIASQVATLRSLHPRTPPSVADLQRRIDRQRHRRVWVVAIAVCVAAVGVAAVGLAARRAAHGPVPAVRPRTGARLITVSGAPAALTILDADGGTTRRVPAPIDPGKGFVTVAVRQNRVVFEGSNNANSHDIFSIDLNQPGRPLLLGTEGYFVPSVDPGRVWIVSHNGLPGQTVREVTAAGATTLAAVPLPNVIVDGATSRGLVIDSGAGLQVWDPSLRRPVATIPGDTLVATDAYTVASCTSPCPTVTLTDVRSGKHRVVSAPGGSTAFAQAGHLLRVAGAFSPDHRQLAMFALDRPEDTEGPAAVAVIDTRTGKLAATPLAVPWPSALAWGADSKWVFFVASPDPAAFQVGALQPGGSPIRLALPALPFPQPEALAVDRG